MDSKSPTAREASMNVAPPRLPVGSVSSLPNGQRAHRGGHAHPPIRCPPPPTYRCSPTPLASQRRACCCIPWNRFDAAPPSVQCRPAEWPSWSRRLVWRPPPPARPYLSLGFPPSCPSTSQSPCDDACCFPDRVSNPSNLHRVRTIVHFPAAPLFRARTICPSCAGAWQCPPGRPGMEIAAAAYPSSALSIRGSMGKRWSCPLARQMLNLASSITSFL